MEPHTSRRLPHWTVDTGEGGVVYLISSAKPRGTYSRFSVELKTNGIRKSDSQKRSLDHTGQLLQTQGRAIPQHPMDTSC